MPPPRPRCTFQMETVLFRDRREEGEKQARPLRKTHGCICKLSSVPLDLQHPVTVRQFFFSEKKWGGTKERVAAFSDDGYIIIQSCQSTHLDYTEALPAFIKPPLLNFTEHFCGWMTHNLIKENKYGEENTHVQAALEDYSQSPATHSPPLAPPNPISPALFHFSCLLCNYFKK